MSQYLVATFDQEKTLFGSIQDLHNHDVEIYEVYTPYPVHNLEHALGYKRSRLPIAAFLFGLVGALGALALQIGMMTYDWPMNIGGKNFLSLPTFIPVTFELTVLLSAFGMVAVFFIVSNLKPWGKPRLFHPRQTQDQHTLVVKLDAQHIPTAEIKKILASAASLHVEAGTGTDSIHTDKKSGTS